MIKKIFKKLPCGNSNYESVRTENYAYVDKTRFIELLEGESNKNHFFIRPRKFGKSLFLSVLSHYYDIRSASKFEQLFGDLYIGKHPTPRKNSYTVMNFNFSGINTSSEEEFKKSFSWKVQETVLTFIAAYRNHFSESDSMRQRIISESPGLGALNVALGISELSQTKLFVIIDEYDHFANDLIAMGSHRGKDFYRNMVNANG